MNSNKLMTFHLEDLAELKTALGGAVSANKKVFVFRGHELLVTYAQYLVQYLEKELQQLELGLEIL